MAELRCEGLVKSYGSRTVLRGVDLFVAQGTLTAILGSSGSGKTTLLRIVMGLIEADSGAIVVGGTTVAYAKRVNVRTDKRSIGYVAQEGALFPHITVGENVGFGLARSERRRGHRISEALELVGLDDSFIPRRPQELSGGEQRRVGLARALAPRPRLVLLDEPFSGLDAALRLDTRAAVVGALGLEGTTSVLVTHDQAEALSMGTEVAVLRDGRLVQSATPTDVYRQPVDVGVAHFVGEAVVLPGNANRGRVTCALGEMEVRDSDASGPVEVMIRPEQIHHMRGTSGAGSSGAGVRARVTDQVYYGPDTVTRFALESDPSTTVKTRTFAHDAPAAGELVDLVVRGPVVVYPPAAQTREHLAVGEAPIQSRSQT
jgi:iron(III) transport system ATP-binding protein